MRLIITACLGCILIGHPNGASPRAGGLMFAPIAFQDGINGEWDIQVNTPEPLLLYAEFAEKNGTLTGSVYNGNTEMKVTGTMEGATLKLELYIDGVTIAMTGELKADSLSGKATAGGAGVVTWTGKRSHP
jgi:hypothetical protein